MTALFLETSTEKGLVALAKENEILFEASFPTGMQSSNTLLPVIEEGLKKTSLTIKELVFIAVGVGPGSYTGIRVGVAAAKAFSFACSLPLIGLSTLQTFAPTSDGPFAVLMDAKIGGVYFQKGEQKGANITYIGEPKLLALDAAGVFLKDIERIFTPTKNSLMHKMASYYPEHRWIWEEVSPRGVQMVKLAREKYRQGEHSLDGHLELLYLRKTQAEIEKEEFKKRGPL